MGASDVKDCDLNVGGFGMVEHIDPERFDAETFASLFYLKALESQLSGYDDGRNAGVVYGNDLDDGRWYPCLSLKAVTYSLDAEDAAELVKEFERRANAPEVRHCAGSVAFFRFFAEVLPETIRNAACKNDHGDVAPGLMGLSLADMPVAGHA